MIDEKTLKIVALLKKLNPVESRAAWASLLALNAGATFQEAIEAGNVELIKGGKKPLNPDAVIKKAKLDSTEHPQSKGGVFM